MNPRSATCVGLASIACLAITPAAMAHPDALGPAGGGVFAGMMHPLSGLDHLIAMVCSGLLAVRIRDRRALWAVPLSFVGLMLLGGAIAALGVHLPHAEWAVSGSVVVLALGVIAAPRMSIRVGAAFVGVFALFHGHVHVEELGEQMLIPFMAGFALSTLALHAAAIATGQAALLAARRPAGSAIGAAE